MVDSGSTDGTRELIRDSGVTLIDLAAERFNYARAYNRGAAAATSPFLVRLSGDALPGTQDWLRALLAPLQADPTVAAAWGRQEIPAHVRNPVERWAETSLRPAAWQSPRRYQRVVTVLGSGMALRRDLWAASPFDERLPQAEDYAWVHHWLRRGYAGVYVPNAVIVHGHDEPLGRAVKRSLAQSALQGMVLAGVTEWGSERRRRVDTGKAACYHPGHYGQRGGTDWLGSEAPNGYDVRR